MADTVELRMIVQRLEAVERENRRLKRAYLVVAIFVCALLLMGQAHPTHTIEGERFVLKDANGKVRATLGMESKDRPILALLDPKGFPQVSLGAGEDPFLNLCRGHCESQIQIGTYSDAFGVAIYGKDKGGPLHGVRAALGVVKGLPGLNLFGEDDPTEQASLDFEAGGPRLVLSHDGGVVALQKTSVELSDNQGFRTTIGTTELETPRTGETHKTSAASIVLFGKDGKTLWSAP